MELRDLSANSPYVPGRGVEEVARELGVSPDDLITLSSNENPHGPSPAAVEAIREGASGVHAYPKASHADLSSALADRWGVDSNQVWLAPGADGALDYLARAMLKPGDEVLVPDPGFAYYSMSARYHHGTVSSYGLSKDDQFRQDASTVLQTYDGERIVYLTSPHNPTGTELPQDALDRLATDVADDTLLVVDEAYGEYTETPSAAELLGRYGNVAVTRTFSKAYGLAGLRVGYALVPSSWADAYQRINTPFAVNELACRAGLAALDDEEHVRRSVESAVWARKYIADHLNAPTFKSTGNFVLAEVGDGTAVAEAAKREGVIVRDTSSFGLPECIRISCGTRTETRTAVEELNQILSESDLQPEEPEVEP